MMKTVVIEFLVFCAASVCACASFSDPPSYEQAMQLFQSHRWAEAAAAFELCEKAEPGKSAAELYRGKALVNLGSLEDAAAALEKFRATHPQSDDAAYLLAYIRFRQDKPKESLQLFTEAARLHDPTADDLKLIALDYVLLGDYDDAARYLEQSLARVPENTEVRYHLGRVRYQQNRFDLAIAAFQEVLQRDPANSKAQNNLGLSLEAKNEIDAALDAYRKAVALDEKLAVHNEQPYLNLGALMLKLGHADHAVPLLSRASEIDPQSAKVHYQLAKTYFDLNRLAEALREAEKAAQLEPDGSSNHYLLGRIYQRSGKKDLADRQFKLTERLIQAKSSDAGGMATGSQHP
jgi:tetratricopeptide (TPR) repeat protein